MFDLLLPTTVGLAETQGGGEDGPTPLSGLYGARDKAAAVAHPFDVIEDGDFGVTGENEVAVHAVDGKVGGNGSHGRGEGLRNRGTTVDAAGPGWVPEGSSVGEDILYHDMNIVLAGVGRPSGGMGMVVGVLPAQCRQRASVPRRFRSVPWRNPVAEGRTRSHFWPFLAVETNGCRDTMLILYRRYIYQSRDRRRRKNQNSGRQD